MTAKKQKPGKRQPHVKEDKADPKQREAVFQAQFLEDLRYWIGTNTNTAKRTLDLVDAVLKSPFIGIGKPEPLKYMGANVWSRRITQVDRLVYLVQETRIDFLQARYHY